MSEDWPMEQEAHTAVLVARSLLDDPGKLDHVLADDEDGWLVGDDAEHDLDEEHYASMCLHDVVDLLPQVTALAGLPAGMGAIWDAERTTWVLLSPDEPDGDADAREYREARLAEWVHPGSPMAEANVSVGLTEISAAADAPARAVRYLSREDDGTWLFVGFEVPDPDEQSDVEVDTLELGHVAALYPEVVELLDAEPGEVFYREAPDAEWIQMIEDGK
ncbi:hypothetical protein [Amycolatopsis benzoatilytica]|uniref:hypothetical protein n=1 Tax=Amycolatopsis benzoatilytica TaxID=346045 RepID=UPI00048869D3|nr:hypothetical protein [Amycolatopsis benzoatilytica]